MKMKPFPWSMDLWSSLFWLFHHFVALMPLIQSQYHLLDNPTLENVLPLNATNLKLHKGIAMLFGQSFDFDTKSPLSINKK